MSEPAAEKKTKSAKRKAADLVESTPSVAPVIAVNEPKEKEKAVQQQVSDDDYDPLDPCYGGTRNRRPKTEDRFEAFSRALVGRLEAMDESMIGLRSMVSSNMAVQGAKHPHVTDVVLAAIIAAGAVGKLCATQVRSAADMVKVFEAMQSWAIDADSGRVDGHRDFRDMVDAVAPLSTSSANAGRGCTKCGRNNHQDADCRASTRLSSGIDRSLPLWNARSGPTTMSPQYVFPQPTPIPQPMPVMMPQVTYQQQQPANANSGRGSGGGLCFRCRQPGHLSRDCTASAPFASVNPRQ